MSLDVSLFGVRLIPIFEATITHNLTRMADAAGIYRTVWRPEELGIKNARKLIQPLEEGIALLKSDPERFRQFDSPNNWGTYDQFVPWLERYILACRKNPDAEIGVFR